MNEAPQKKRSLLKILGIFLLKIISGPYTFFFRLSDDEKKRKKFNRTQMEEGLRKGMIHQRRIMLGLAVFLIVSQISILIAIFFGVGTTGYGNPNLALNLLVSRMRIPNVDELFSLPLLVSLISMGPLGHFLYWFTYLRSSSIYQLGVRYIEAEFAGILPEKGEKYFYYPQRILALFRMRNSVGKDLMNRHATWNNMNFHPAADPIMIGEENTWVFFGTSRKKSDSSIFTDHYEEWTELAIDKRRNLQWFLGEYVGREGFSWRKADADFSIAFLGTSGSGKTEFMKMWLTMFMIKNPGTRLIIADLKGGGDWDVFASYTEAGRILKKEEESLLALRYADDIFESRRRYMGKHSFNNFSRWSQVEKRDIPPVIIIIDEFPQMKGPLKYDYQYTKAGTPANALFRLMTMGRSQGTFFHLGSQFAGSDIIPPEVNKNIQVRVILKVSPGESSYWLKSDCAADLGKSKRLPNGDIDNESGRAFIGAPEESVRGWYMQDFYIEHELRKYRVSTIAGKAPPETREPSMHAQLARQLEALTAEGKNREALDPYYQKLLVDHENAYKKFKPLVDALRERDKKEPVAAKRPLGVTFLATETAEEYAARSGKFRASTELTGFEVGSEDINDMADKFFASMAGSAASPDRKDETGHKNPLRRNDIQISRRDNLAPGGLPGSTVKIKDTKSAPVSDDEDEAETDESFDEDFNSFIENIQKSRAAAAAKIEASTKAKETKNDSPGEKAPSDSKIENKELIKDEDASGFLSQLEAKPKPVKK